MTCKPLGKEMMVTLLLINRQLVVQTEARFD